MTRLQASGNSKILHVCCSIVLREISYMEINHEYGMQINSLYFSSQKNSPSGPYSHWGHSKKKKIAL